MTNQFSLLWVVLGAGTYLLGALPLGYWLTRRVTGIQLDRFATGNTGVANAFRAGPPWLGGTIVLLDILRMLGFLRLGERYWALSREALYFGLLMMVAGNMHSVFLSFRGSKGRTLSLWGMLYLQPLVLLVLTGIWGLGFAVTGRSRKAVWWMLPLIAPLVGYAEGSVPVFLMALGLTALYAVNNGENRDDFAYQMELIRERRKQAGER